MNTDLMRAAEKMYRALTDVHAVAGVKPEPGVSEAFWVRVGREGLKEWDEALERTLGKPCQEQDERRPA